jgi:hypothetical protein
MVRPARRTLLMAGNPSPMGETNLSAPTAGRAPWDYDVQAGGYRPSFGLVPINALVFTNYEYRVNSRIVGNPEVMSIAKWYLRSTSACAVIKEPVSALPGSAFRGTVETEDYLEGSLVWRERKRRKKVNPLFL